MSDDDPLDGADIGETVHVVETDTLHSINFAHPEAFNGSDRMGYPDITDVELVEDDEGYHDIRVTWEGDVTKRLPRRWGHRDEPVTEAERKATRRERWRDRLLTATPTVITMAIVTAVSWKLSTVLFDGSVSINGEPMTAPTAAEFAAITVMIMVLAAIIAWGVGGGFPGRVKAR